MIDPSLSRADPASLSPTFVNESGLTDAELADAHVPRLGQPEVQVGNRDRVGGTLALQRMPSDDLSFSLDVIYSELEANAGFDLGGHTLRVNAGLRYVQTDLELLGFIQRADTPRGVLFSTAS